MSDARVVMPRASKRYEDLRSVAGGAVMTALAWALAAPLIPGPWGQRVAIGVTVIAAVVTVIDVLILNRRLWRFFYAEMGDGTLVMHTGRLLSTDMSVRRDAVLSVDVNVGPILRKWGLARVKLNGIAAFPEFPVLAHADALAIQAALTHAIDPDRADPA